MKYLILMFLAFQPLLSWAGECEAALSGKMTLSEYHSLIQELSTGGGSENFKRFIEVSTQALVEYSTLPKGSSESFAGLAGFIITRSRMVRDYTNGSRVEAIRYLAPIIRSRAVHFGLLAYDLKQLRTELGLHYKDANRWDFGISLEQRKAELNAEKELGISRTPFKQTEMLALQSKIDTLQDGASMSKAKFTIMLGEFKRIIDFAIENNIRGSDVATIGIAILEAAGWIEFHNTQVVKEISEYLNQKAKSYGLMRADINRIIQASSIWLIRVGATGSRPYTDAASWDWGVSLEDRIVGRKMETQAGVQRSAMSAEELSEITEKLESLNHSLFQDTSYYNKIVSYVRQVLAKSVENHLRSADFTQVMLAVIHTTGQSRAFLGNSSIQRCALTDLAPEIRDTAKKIGLTRNDQRRIIKAMTNWSVPSGSTGSVRFDEPIRWDWGKPIEERVNEAELRN